MTLLFTDLCQNAAINNPQAREMAKKVIRVHSIHRTIIIGHFSEQDAMAFGSVNAAVIPCVMQSGITCIDNQLTQTTVSISPTRLASVETQRLLQTITTALPAILSPPPPPPGGVWLLGNCEGVQTINFLPFGQMLNNVQIVGDNWLF